MAVNAAARRAAAWTRRTTTCHPSVASGKLPPPPQKVCLNSVPGCARHLSSTSALRNVGGPTSSDKKNDSFNSSKLRITFAPPNELKPKPEDGTKLGFGKHFTDHMLSVKWTSEQGWGDPEIGPFKPFQMHPAAKVLHYAQELFEGMKVYRGVDDRIRFFRPLHNMARMVGSAKRACFPTFRGSELVTCIKRLIQIEQEWVPHVAASSLYIRPTMIGIEPTLGVGPANEVQLFVILSPVGPYFPGGLKPVNLLADPKYIRAWPGGCGYVKMGSNYAPTLFTQKIAEKFGCQQCLWLFGEDHEITEVGAMNIFVLLRKPGGGGDLELVTPSLDNGIILPGVTRRSVVELTREWNEFEVNERKITMKEILKAKDEGRLVEVFGTGTAAIVSQVGNIFYNGAMHSIPNSTEESQVSMRILKSMSDIYYGKVKHPWAVDIEAWTTDSSPLETDRLKRYEESITKHLALQS